MEHVLSVTAKISLTNQANPETMVGTVTFSQPIDWDTILQSDNPRQKFLSTVVAIADSLWVNLQPPTIEPTSKAFAEPLEKLKGD
jgi:hypothetical protein